MENEITNRKGIDKALESITKHPDLESFFQIYEIKRKNMFIKEKFKPKIYKNLITWIDENPYISEDELNDFTKLKKEIDYKFLKFFAWAMLFQTTVLGVYLIKKIKKLQDIPYSGIGLIGIGFPLSFIYLFNKMKIYFFIKELNNEERAYLRRLINRPYI